MGQKMLEIYNKASAVGGNKANSRLAIITGMSFTKAAFEPDSDKNIEIFENAMKSIEYEYRNQEKNNGNSNAHKGTVENKKKVPWYKRWFSF